MDLFDWIDHTRPSGVWQGPPRPTHIVTREAFGMELLETAEGRGWSDRWHVRMIATGTTQRLAHLATWGEFHGIEEYLTDEQHRQCAVWWTDFAEGGRDQ